MIFQNVLNNMQVIFLFESNNKNKSDYTYIKDFLITYFKVRTEKISKIFLTSKGEALTRKTERKIENIIKQYTGKENYIVYCLDTDNDAKYNLEIVKYCNNRNYFLVWFNPNIEKLFLNKIINHSKDKTREAFNFVKSNKVVDLNLNDFKEANALKISNKSNLYLILQKIFKVK